MAFLNEAGVSRLWQHILAKLNLKADRSEIKQSDWSQFDDTKIDYIKNRPFYKDEVVTPNVVLIDTITAAGVLDNSLDTGSYKISLPVITNFPNNEYPETLKITFDGEEYEVYADSNTTIWSGVTYYGNPQLVATGFLPMYEEPFFFCPGFNAFYVEDSAQHTIKIETGEIVESTIVKLPLEFMPDHTHTYAGSTTAGGAANSVKSSMTVKLNSGNTEGTNKFTYNGASAKTVNITADKIGAAPATHNHAASEINSGTLSSDRLPTIPVAKGGTGATDAATALTNLGAVSQADFDALTIGGTNLLVGSGVPIEKTTYKIGSYNFGVNPPQEDEIVTIRIWGTLGSDRTQFLLHNTSGNADTHLGYTTNNGDGTHSLTVKWQIGSSNNTSLQIYQLPSSGTTASKITKIKLERGNKATDWSPAPEDINGHPTNILDNSDFTNYVNQRRTTSTQSDWKICIDRWIASTANGQSVWHDSNHIGIYGGSKLIQKIEGNNIVAGKKYTLACKQSDGKLSVASGTATAASSGSTVYSINGSMNSIGLQLYSVGDGYWYALISNQASSTTAYHLDWAALYEGEYTAETLPKYTAKGYGAELVQAMRYYQIGAEHTATISTDNGGYLVLSDRLPIPMIATPTLTAELKAKKPADESYVTYSGTLTTTDPDRGMFKMYATGYTAKTVYIAKFKYWASCE